MTQIRVGIDVTPLLGPPSGIHQVTRGLIEGLAGVDDLEVTGWTLSARGGRPALEFPIRRSRFPAGLAQRFWSRSGFPPTRLVAGRVDVVHGTNFLVPPSPNSVVSVQDLTPVTHPDWVRPEVAAMAGPLLNAIERGATLHTSSQAVADEAARVLDIDQAQIAVVHHGVGPISQGDPARAVELAGTGPFILALGTVERRKSIPSLVEAMAVLPDDITLVIAGPPGNDEAALAATVEADSGPRRVVRIPELDDHDRASLLRAAAVLAFPSRYEGYGLPPLEALLVGTPVVATAVGALPELVSDRLELIPPGDMVGFAESLADTLARGGCDPELTNRVEALTWPRAAAEMAEVYRSLL